MFLQLYCIFREVAWSIDHGWLLTSLTSEGAGGLDHRSRLSTTLLLIACLLVNNSSQFVFAFCNGQLTVDSGHPFFGHFSYPSLWFAIFTCVFMQNANGEPGYMLCYLNNEKASLARASLTSWDDINWEVSLQERIVWRGRGGRFIGITKWSS